MADNDPAAVPCHRAAVLPRAGACYAGEIDPHTGRHLGNFRRAFSHLALSDARVHLICEDERVAAG